MVPASKTTNGILYALGWLSGGLLAMGWELYAQLNMLPEAEAVHWRSIITAGLFVLLSTALPFLATMGLPRYGKEDVAVLTSKLGKEQTVDALQTRVESLDAVKPMVRARRRSSTPKPIHETRIATETDPTTRLPE